MADFGSQPPPQPSQHVEDAASLASRPFAARFVEAHQLVLVSGQPPLELSQRPPALEDDDGGGGDDPLDTGGTVWRGGARLARALADDAALRTLIAGRRVLELGAGTGVGGLACAALGARSVVLTDLPRNVELLRANAFRNRGHTLGCDVAAVPLAWGDRHGALAAAAAGVDVVLAADVCYREDAVEPLAATIGVLMAHAETLVLACERHEPVAYAALLRALGEALAGGDVRASEDGGRFEIRVYSRRRAA